MDHCSASTPPYDLLKWFLAPRLGSGTDLSAMRKCAEALRDRPVLLRSALNVLRRDERALRAVAASRSSVHPNGFAKVVLSRGDGWSLRLHVWSPQIGSGDDADPHGHRWAFASWIIAGILRETRFDVAHDGRPFRHYEYLGSSAADKANRPNGTVTLVEVEEIERVAGTVYQRTGAEVHTAEPCTDLVATLVLHGESAESADVFKRPGKRGDAREIPLSVEDLTALLDAVLAALP